MRAPFAESHRGVSIHIEVPEDGQPGRLVARRSVSAGAPSLDGLEEVMILTHENAVQVIDWVVAWAKADGTFRWLHLAREIDLSHRKRPNPTQSFTVAV